MPSGVIVSQGRGKGGVAMKAEERLGHAKQLMAPL